MNEPGDIPDRLKSEFDIGPVGDAPFSPGQWAPVITLWMMSGKKAPEKALNELKRQMNEDPTFRAEIRSFLLDECGLKITSPEVEFLDSIRDE